MLKSNYKNKVWSRLTWLWIIACLLSFTSGNISAQCTNTSAYGTVTAPTAGGSATIGCQYAGEYGTVNTVAAGAYFKSTSTVATDFCTVRQGSSSGTVIAFGTQPLYWQATVAGTYYIHWNTNSSCGTQSSCRDAIITSMVGCTNASAYGSVTAPTNTTPAVIGCQYGGEYATINSVQAGKTYVTGSTVATDYFTIHMGSPSGPIVAAGPQPLTWTAAAAGTYYQHCNTNSSCGTQSSCRDASIYCIDCLTACSGAPAASNTISSANPVCGGTGFNLSLSTNYSTLGNIFYQWQSSPDNVTYSNIIGATSATYTASQTVATWYQCVVSCGSGGPSTSSTPVQVTMNSNFLACYCIPTTTNGCASGDHITNVTFAGINNSTGNCISGGSYSNYFAQSGSVVQLNSYTLNVTVNNGGTEYAGAWIDYDHSGTFDASEFIALTGSLSGSWNYSGTATIPIGALTGNTGFRVRSSYNAPIASTSACSTYSYGETEDYTLDIIATTACSGTPNPGNTVASVAAACPSASITLSLQNAQTATNITFDWQSSPDGVTYTSTGGATATYVTSQTSDTYYQCLVTCTNSAQSAMSTPIQVTMNPFYNCYCTTGLGGSCGINAISSVAVATTTLNNVTSGCTGTYNAFPASGSTTASFAPGVPYSMTIGCISGSNTQAAIWIDYNHDGIYSAAEYTLINGNIPSGGTGSGSFTVPLTALAGSTGMRVRSDWQGTTAFTAADACTNRTWGETEDYTITILVAGNCSGTPAASATSASVTSACPGTSVTLNTSPAYTDLGLTFDWQSSPDGITYTSTGITTQQYIVASFSATTWYQCVITCTNGGSPTTSTPIQVTLNPFYNCYCTITNAGGSCLTNVTLNTLNHTTPGCENSPSNYTVVPIGTATTTIYQGFAYNLSVTTDGGAIESVWIDYDHSGTFDATEWAQVATSSTAGAPSTISLTIPLTALTGNTGMRIRSRASGNQNGAGDACLAMGSGESQDYTIDIQTPAGCTGTPAPGSTSSTSGSLACSAQPFTLSMPGLAFTTGLTYQWYSSPDGVTYTAVSGATLSTLTTSQTAATYYYCDVTCTNSGLTGSSTALNLGMNSFVNCYCTPNSQFGTSGGFYGVISNVTFNTLNNTSTYPSVSPYYTNYPVSAGTTTTVVAGATYNMDITSGNYNWAGAWFDWNQNGLFESSEFTSFGNNSTGSVWTGTQAITVPTGAVAGTTKMRVRTEYYFNAFSGTDACTLLQYGESEDYTITVNPAVVCSGSPAAATTTSTANPICSGINFTLAPNTLYTEAGLTYDWQSSPDGITYTSTGVTTQLYTVNQITSTYYQLVVTCTNGGLSTTTTPLQVTMNSLANCYCTAGNTTIGCVSGDEYVGNVTINTINNTSSCPGSGNQYTDFTSISTSLQIGNTYTASVLIPNWFSGDQAAVWIDFDQDGTFNTTTEQFILLTGGGSGTTPLSGDITIPASALTGSTRMRVRGTYTGALAPCGSVTYGEVEDYTVNIAAPTCISLPTYPADGSNGCPDGSNITLSWPALAGSTGYDVYVGITDPPTTLVSSNQPGLTFNADISGGAPTYYWMVVPQIAGGGVSCTVWSFGLNAAPEPMAGSGGDPCEGTTLSLSADNNAAGQSSGNTYAWSGPASYSSIQQNPNINNATGAIAGTYTVVVTNAQLCTASATVDVAVNPNPVATVSSFQNVGCIGGSDGEVTLGGNTVGPYQYSNDGVNYYSSPTFTGLPTGPGTYYLVDGNNCQAAPVSKSLTYTSTVPPSANVIVPFIGMPVNVCNGTSVVLSIPAVSNTTMYIWDAPTGAYFNGNPFNVSPFTTTTPSVQVTYGNPTASLYETGVQAANGCGASLRKVQKSRGTISVPVSVSGATTRCAGTTDTYTTPAVTAASSYEWTITGDATVTGTGTTATVTFGPTWTGGILCVAAKTSCYKTPTKCITIGTSSSQLNAISGSFTACPNQTLTYSVPVSTGAASYNWSLPSGATGSSTTNSISAAFGAGYSAVGSVCVNVTSICGVTSATKCKTVAPGLPAQPSSISGALSGVCNQTIVYGCPPVSGTTYNWTTPSGTIIQSGQGTSNISAHFSALTTGSVCVTATNSCGSSISRCVPVKGAPNAPGAITPTPSSWCAGDQIEFAVNTSAMSGAFTLNWAYPPASVATYVIGGGNSNSLILDWIGGSGAVNVTASNACGGATKPSTWSSSCREGAVAEVNALSVSPNPTTGILNISYTATKGHTRLMVLDLAGRVVMNEQIASIEGSNNTQLDMSRLAKGAYMLSVQSTQGNKQVRVVVE